MLVSATDELQTDDSHSFVSKTIPVFQEEIEHGDGHGKMVGVIRYHYDSAVSSSCQHVLLLGVGTFMSVGDYDKISQAIVSAESIVVAITDHNVDNFEKTSPSKYASLTNEIIYQLNTLIPICKYGEARILIGGHSASGQAAMQAWQQGLIDRSKVSPLGFIGLDPYLISKKTMDETVVFDLPGLYWGFTRTTCQVTVEKAAQAAYRITEESARVLYSIHNENHESSMTHCVFTDNGCGVPPLSCSTSAEFDWVYGKVAESVRLYLKSLTNAAPFTREHFILTQSFDEDIGVHVNEDCPSAGLSEQQA